MITEIVERDWTTKYGYRCIIIGKDSGFRDGYIGFTKKSTYFEKTLDDRLKEFDGYTFEGFLTGKSFGPVFAGRIDKEEFGSLEDIWWIKIDYDTYEYNPDPYLLQIAGKPLEEEFDENYYLVLYLNECVKELDIMCKQLYEVDKKLQRIQKLEKLLK